MILSIENLTKTYGDKTLFEHISFGIEEGDKIGIVGVNGTGKSTFIRTIAGLVPADAGNMIKAKNMRLGYLAQDSELTAENTVLMEVFKGTDPLMQVLREYEMLLGDAENHEPKQQERLLKLSQQIDELDGWQVESDAKTVLTKLGISDYSAKAGELSGGMGQRVIIAIALINDPRVLIADEPTSALDVRLRNQILELLVTQCEQRQMAMLLISHDLPLVAQFCHRVLVMYQGNKVDEMHAAALPTATHPYTRTLWTCRPNAQTYGQMLPTLDRTAMTPEKYHDDC